MKVKILEIRKFKGQNSKEFCIYQIALLGQKVWVSQLDFSNNSDLIILEDDIISLKEPIKDYYEIVKKENKRGKFITLIPKTKSDSIKTYGGKGQIIKLLKDLGADPNWQISDKKIINEIMEEEISSKADLENEMQVLSDFEVQYEIDELETRNKISDESFIEEIIAEEETLKEEEDRLVLPPKPDAFSVIENKSTTPQNEPEKKEESEEKGRVLKGEEVLKLLGGKRLKMKTELIGKKYKPRFKSTKSPNPEVDEKQAVRISDETPPSPANNDEKQIIPTKPQKRGDKLVFINELLRMSNSKNVSEKTRERVINLVSKEAVGNDGLLKELQKEVSEIKKYINKTPPSNTKQPDLHNPKTLVEYLYKFSSDENLKWLTHEKETDFDYALILEEAKKTFQSFKKTLVPFYTYVYIQNFIFGNKDKNYPSLKLFGNKSIYIDWSSVEVQEWCKINPGVYPSRMPLSNDKQYPIKGNKNYILLTFGDVIKEFKHFIEIRTDDEQRTFDLRLSDLMRRVGLFPDFNKPKFDELFKSVNVYIGTNQLFEGFEQIFKWCLEHRAKSNRIEITIESESEFYLLKIKHIGSKIGYERDSSKLNGLGGDLNKVRKLFFNICDWEIHTILSDGKSYRIELLSNDVNDLEKPSLVTEMEPVDGVIHIIKLYKTVNL